MKIKIAVLMPNNATRDSFITPKVMSELEKLGDVVYNKENYSLPAITKLLNNANICVTGWGCPSINTEVLTDAKQLRLVAHTGGSVASIVSPALYERGITVISGNELYAESVAEGTIAYILAGLRRISYYDNNMQKGGWRPGSFDNKGLLDRSVGLVGFGAVTRHLVPLLKAFRVKVMVCCKYLSDEDCQKYGMIRTESMEQLFSSCDIVSLHLARTRETYHAIDKNLLSLMPDGALFINTARGSIVDEQALADELSKGRIHAVLDVFEEEPLPTDSRLRGLDNVILIPHMAGPTGDRHEYISMALVEDMRRMLAGQPLVHTIEQSLAMRMTNDALKFI